MGKGKGSIVRYCSRVFQNHNILEFLGYSYRDILILKKIFLKKVNIPIKVYSNFFIERHSFVNGRLESNINIKKYKKQKLIIKSTYKSHFKIKKSSKNKTVFVKNMFIFILFSKTVLKSCRVTTMFFKKNTTSTDILKAPSRHKKFFHHVHTEYFFLKISFLFLKKFTLNALDFLNFFKKSAVVFKKFGSNTLNNTRYSLSGNVCITVPHLTLLKRQFSFFVR